MHDNIPTRRDFLKIASLYGMGLFFGTKQHAWLHNPAVDGSFPSVIILVFDAMSARHLSLYGYPRKTTPNLTRFAERATVFHRHYSAGNFTTPGVASLLSGLYPWTHRAFNQAGLVLRSLAKKNIFEYFQQTHETFSFSQSVWADLLLYQYDNAIDVHLHPSEFSAFSKLHYTGGLLSNDTLNMFRSYDDFLTQGLGSPGSLFSSLFDKLLSSWALETELKKYANEYPRGVPNLLKYKLSFTLEEVMDGVISLANSLQDPSLAYFHYFPPHEPFYPRKEYMGIFDDDWKPPAKPLHPLSKWYDDEYLNKNRREYDEYITNVDAEFGRLYDALESSGRLENSYFVVTSDHGKLFERGEHGHSTPLLYDGVIHIPLIISAPGQVERRDIHSLTSSVDVFPTLLHANGQSVPDYAEGSILPGLGGQERVDRAIFVIEAKENAAHSPLTRATLAIMKGDYKLIRYIGYPDHADSYELFNLIEDPEELNDIYATQPEIAQSLRNELLENLQTADEPYRIWKK